MANVALITTDVAGDNISRLRNLLQEQGHTVSVYSQYSIPALTSFNLIITTRTDKASSNYYLNLVSAFNAGIPVICGSSREGSNNYFGETGDQPANILKLAKNIQQIESTGAITTESNIEDLDFSYIQSGVGYNVYSAGDLIYTIINSSDFASSARVLHRIGSPNSVVTLCAKKGDLDATGSPFTSNILYVGWLYFFNTMPTAAVKPILNDLIEFALKTIEYTVSGYVETDDGIPLQRTLRLYDINGSLKKSTISNISGHYQFILPNSEQVTVVCEGVAGNNSQIKSNITPKVLS